MESIGWRNPIINHYLLTLPEGLLLIDTGYAEQYGPFKKQLRARGLSLADIRYVLLTHAHDDHAGFLNKLLAQTEARVILHPEAVGRLASGRNSFEGGCTSLLSLAFCLILGLFGKGEHRFEPVDRPGRYLSTHTDVSQLERILPGRIVELPGHTPDSIGLLTDDGTLYCGDAAMHGLPSSHRISIWMEDQESYVRSWERILEMAPREIRPSHGRPFPPDDLAHNLARARSTRVRPLR